MNLSFIKDFFTCQANVEQLVQKKKQSLISNYPRLGLFSMFKQVSLGSKPQLNAIHIKKYLSQFSINLQAVNPNEINRYSSQRDFGEKTVLSDDEVLERGINLFLNYWGNNQKQFSFTEFSKFMKNEQSQPQKPQQIPYPAKKKLFEIFQTQIQGLLNVQTLRSVCLKQYRNLTDLFEMLASKESNQINKESIENLYLMHSERMTDKFLDRVQKRLKLPMNFEAFLKTIKGSQNLVNQRAQERKVYYSSARRKKADIDDFQIDNISQISNQKANMNFQTPKTQKVADRAFTSTKLTKGEKASDFKQASVTVARYKQMQTPQRSRKTQLARQKFKQIQILGQILAFEEKFIELKRKLCYRKDFDLELVYERLGLKFEYLLNKLYEACNFTAFVRFIVPQDFQHRYLTFVRHQTTNILSNQTIQAVNELLQAYDRKQHEIEILWDKIDKQMMFRMYCNPCDKNIQGEELTKYFTQRQCRVLMDRMDPLRTGQISFSNFK